MPNIMMKVWCAANQDKRTGFECLNESDAANWNYSHWAHRLWIKFLLFLNTSQNEHFVFIPSDGVCVSCFECWQKCAPQTEGCFRMFSQCKMGTSLLTAVFLLRFCGIINTLHRFLGGGESDLRNHMNVVCFRKWKWPIETLTQGFTFKTLKEASNSVGPRINSAFLEAPIDNRRCPKENVWPPLLSLVYLRTRKRIQSEKLCKSHIVRSCISHLSF